MERSLSIAATVLALLTAGCSGDDGASVPAAPSGLTASLMGNQPHLTWTDNADDEDAFAIQRMVTNTGAFAVIDTETFDIEQYHDMSVASGTSYTYRIVATNAQGESAPSNEMLITTP